MSLTKVTLDDTIIIENLLKRIAKEHNIQDVTEVQIDISGAGSVVRYHTAEFNILDILSKFMKGMKVDPEIKEIAGDIVQQEIDKPDSMMAGKDKDKYVQMIIDIVNKGADQVFQQFVQQQQQQQKNNPPTATASETMIQSKFAFAPFLGFDLDTVSNALGAAREFLFGESRAELIDKLVARSLEIGAIPKGYAEQFKNYISTFIDSGFKQVQQEVEQQKQEAQGQKEQQKIPGNPKYERDSAGNMVEYQRQDGGKAYKVTYDAASGKPPIYVTAEPPHTLVANNQIVQQGTQVDTAEQEQQQQVQQQQSGQQTQPAGTAQQQQVAASSNERTKKALALGSVFKGIAKYAPELVSAAKIVYEVWKKNKKAEEAPLEEDEPGILEGMLDTIQQILQSIESGLKSESTDFILEVLRDRNINLDEFKSKLIHLVEVLNKLITDLRSNEFTTDENNEFTEEPIEADIIKLNSTTFLIPPDRDNYKILEQVAYRVAQDNKLRIIEGMHISITPEGAVARTNKQAQEANVLPALAAGFASHFDFLGSGNESSGVTTAANAFEASLFGFSAIAGQQIARYMGFGTLGQLIGGGISSLAWALIASDSDSEKVKKQKSYASKETMDAMLQKPQIREQFDAFKKDHPGLTEEQIWPEYLDSLAKANEIAEANSGTVNDGAISYSYSYQ